MSKENPLAVVEADVVEAVGFFPLIEYVGCGRGIPYVTYVERYIEVDACNALVVHIDGLVYQMQ